MGQANLRGNRELRKQEAILKAEKDKEDYIKRKKDEWYAMSKEEQQRQRAAQEWLAIFAGMCSPYVELLRRC